MCNIIKQKISFLKNVQKLLKKTNFIYQIYNANVLIPSLIYCLSMLGDHAYTAKNSIFFPEELVNQDVEGQSTYVTQSILIHRHPSMPLLQQMKYLLAGEGEIVPAILLQSLAPYAMLQQRPHTCLETAFWKVKEAQSY